MKINIFSILSFATSICLATQRVFGMESPHQDEYTVPKELLVCAILKCPIERQIQMRSINHFMRDSVDKAHEKGQLLEELVYARVIHNTIYLKVGIRIEEPKEHYGIHNGAGIHDGAARYDCYITQKLPQNIGEFRDWCINGYKYKFDLNEDNTDHHALCTISWDRSYYSFALFKYGIIHNCLPLIRYTLEPCKKILKSRVWLTDLIKEQFNLKCYLLSKSDENIPAFLCRDAEFMKLFFNDDPIDTPDRASI
jgi:hypothetical protein